MISMKELVEFVVRSLVDHPDEVSVSESSEGSQVLLELRVADSDMGRVIGRKGRVINSIRALVQVAAAREGARASLELVED